MNLDPKITSDARRWFFGAGLAAILLSIFLAVTDYRLSHSDREKVLGATLKELRTAQSTLPSRVTDSRQGSGVAGFAAPSSADHTDH
ncbi:MAG: hypothetical protein RL417_2418 [Pseudomonadota bacterium]|jgi:hypothetical protein